MALAVTRLLFLAEVYIDVSVLNREGKWLNNYMLHVPRPLYFSGKSRGGGRR